MRAPWPVLASPARSAATDGDELTLARFAASVRRVMDPAVALDDDPMRGFFRIGEGSGRYDAIEAAADTAAERVLREAVAVRRAALDTAVLPGFAVVDIPAGRASSVFALQRSASGAPVAVYGFTLSWKESFPPLAERVLRRTIVVPPSYFDADAEPDVPLAADSLIAIRMVDDTGWEFYRSPAQFESSASGSFRGSVSPITVHATLHPALAAQLRASMLNDTRRTLQFALPILTLLLAAATVLHLRRERELVRARRDFVASVSHDLRTPHAQIRMFAETLLLGREESEEERMRWLAVIGRESRRLGDLVENILLFSHIDAARVRLEPERTDLGELVEEIVEAYVPVAVSLHMRIVADAPSRIFAVVDARALRQVVVNLIDNALKYGPTGQTVTVEVEREGTTARIAVSDQGPGVPAADRARLWRPFVRLERTASAAAGSGIGLSVVRTLVEQHGGSVRVEDAAGGGARFVVELPLAPASALPAPDQSLLAAR